MSKKITILGAGSWGMAIGQLLFKNGNDITLWEYNKEDFEIILENRNHPRKLPQVKLDNSIKITNNIEESVQDSELIVLAVPSQKLRSTLVNIPKTSLNNAVFVNLAKGIENETLLRMSDLVISILDYDPALVTTLSGPSHAEEVAMDYPTAIVVAGSDGDILSEIQNTFSTDTFRVYQSDDIIGVELGGSLKNIIAIGAGIASGLGTGDNTLGALITRGLAEITRLGVKLGAKAETFAGLSGIGDLITTCASKHSRNRYVGEQIGRGLKLDEILSSMSMVAEGVQTTKSGFQLAEKFDVEMPITKEVNEVLFENKPPEIAVKNLMTRSLKNEVWQ